MIKSCEWPRTPCLFHSFVICVYSIQFSAAAARAGLSQGHIYFLYVSFHSLDPRPVIGLRPFSAIIALASSLISALKSTPVNVLGRSCVAAHGEWSHAGVRTSQYTRFGKATKLLVASKRVGAWIAGNNSYSSRSSHTGGVRWQRTLVITSVLRHAQSARPRNTNTGQRGAQTGGQKREEQGARRAEAVITTASERCATTIKLEHAFPNHNRCCFRRAKMGMNSLR